jgi:hypothetical protein
MSALHFNIPSDSAQIVACGSNCLLTGQFNSVQHFGFGIGGKGGSGGGGGGGELGAPPQAVIFH